MTKVYPWASSDPFADLIHTIFIPKMKDNISKTKINIEIVIDNAIDTRVNKKPLI